MDVLTKEDSSALELKFYPIIPNVVNVLTGEFSKRYSKVQFRAVDDTSYNELLDQKRSMIEENLLADAESKLLAKMLEMGADPESEEFQQQMSPENNVQRKLEKTLLIFTRITRSWLPNFKNN